MFKLSHFCDVRLPCLRSILLRWIYVVLTCLTLCFHLSVSLTSTAIAQGVDCESPNILFVLDYSGSMNDNNKWDQAIDALNQVTVAFDNRLRFGLMHFPTDGNCAVGPESLWSPIAAMGGAALRQSLLGRSPSGSTPLALAITRAAEYYDMLNDQVRKNIIVVITDGNERCNGDPVNSCRDAFSRNYQTFVIGFGQGTANGGNTLNQMAIAGGSQQYYQANNATQLFETLQTIARQATDEICDGIDNDCDGDIDENIAPVPCDSNCGLGEKICLPGGMFSNCQGGQIPMETCDNMDNDCDGNVDEIEAIPCEIDGVSGVSECLPGGVISECDPGERAEICDGADNDIDGITDEDTESECSIECHLGRILCIEGQLTGCTAAPVVDEVCNGADDDCDGLIDEMASCVGSAMCGDGRCLEPCQSGECPTEFFCSSDNYCHPNPCSPECPVGYRCNSARECVVPCTVNSQCEPYGVECNFMRQECDLTATGSQPNPTIEEYNPTMPPPAGMTANPNPGTPNQDPLTSENTSTEGGSSCERASHTSSVLAILLALIGLLAYRRRLSIVA